MSEKCLTEVSYDEHPGFSSKLFFNMSDYTNCLTPKRDANDFETSRLSIESLTPGTTPKGTEKIRTDSNFRFCLSKDLLQRLEQSSPFTVYSDRKGLVPDIFLGCENDDENFEKNSNLSDGHKFLATPSTIENSNIFTSIYDKQAENYSKDSCVKKLNFNKENESGALLTNSNSNYVYNTYNTACANLGVLSSFGKNVGNVYSVNQQYFINPNNGINSNGSNLLPKDFNFNNIPFNFSHSDSKNTSKSMINTLLPQCNENMFNGSNTTINMYGKNGWICLFCKNFNYEGNINIKF
jgi:hypothetical protein